MPSVLTETRHYRLSRQLRQYVQQMDEGDTLPTQRELKNRYSVSQATLDRALSRLVREGLVHRPAGRQRLIRAPLADPALHRVVIIRPDYPSGLVEGICRALVDMGQARDWAFDYVYYRQENRLDLTKAIGLNDGGILLPDTNKLPEHLCKALQRPRKPIVVVQESYDAVGVPCIASDEQKMAELAVEYLLGLGHQRIAILVPETRRSAMNAAIEGWSLALDRAGLEPEPNLIINSRTPRVVAPEINRGANQSPALGVTRTAAECGYSAMRDWLRTPAAASTTAVFCATHEMSMAALRALREQKIAVPDQFSVVGSDGVVNLGAFLCPSLTVVTYEMQLYATAVVETLEQLLGSGPADDPPDSVTIPSFIIERESCSRPPMG